MLPVMLAPGAQCIADTFGDRYDRPNRDSGPSGMSLSELDLSLCSGRYRKDVSTFGDLLPGKMHRLQKLLLLEGEDNVSVV